MQSPVWRFQTLRSHSCCFPYTTLCLNSQLIEKVPDAGKDWGQKEKAVSEDDLAGWHHQCNGRELGQTSGDGEGQRGLACCSPWGHKSQTRLGNWTATTMLKVGVVFIEQRAYETTLEFSMQYLNLTHLMKSRMRTGRTNLVPYNNTHFYICLREGFIKAACLVFCGSQLES